MSEICLKLQVWLQFSQATRDGAELDRELSFVSPSSLEERTNVSRLHGIVEKMLNEVHIV